MNKERVIISQIESTALVVPEKEDIQIWYKGVNDKEVTKYLVYNHHKIYTIEQEEEAYEKIINDSNKYIFSIYSIKNKKVIGYISIKVNFINQTGNLALVIFEKDNRGKGHGTNSLNMLLSYAFDILNLRKISLECSAKNEIGLHLYKKTGFKQIGKRKKEWYIDGEYIDIILMEIHKNEFNNLKNK